MEENGIITVDAGVNTETTSGLNGWTIAAGVAGIGLALAGIGFYVYNVIADAKSRKVQDKILENNAEISRIQLEKAKGTYEAEG